MKFITPSPSNDTQEQTRQLLWSHAGHLAPLVKASFPNTKIAKAFSLYNEDTEPDGPSIENLEAAMRMFYTMPLAKQLAALNGWQPHPVRPSLESFRSRDSNGVMQVGLYIAAEPGAKIESFFDVQESNSIHPVQLFISEGATKTDVLDVLRAIAVKIEKDWSTMISQSEHNGTIDGRPVAPPDAAEDDQPATQGQSGQTAEPAEGIPDPERFGVRTVMLMRLARLVAGIQWEMETPTPPLEDLAEETVKLATGPLKEVVDKLLALAVEHFGEDKDGMCPLDAGDAPVGEFKRHSAA